MKRISFNPRFVNEAGNDLIPVKIHTIRQNYDFWKKFEGQEVALFTWEGKPYRSKQKVFCVKRIVSVQAMYFTGVRIFKDKEKKEGLNFNEVANKDGLSTQDFRIWFCNNEYRPGKMAILHFTDFRY